MMRKPFFVNIGVFTKQTHLGELMCRSGDSGPNPLVGDITYLDHSTSDKILMRSAFLGLGFVPFCCSCPSSSFRPSVSFLASYCFTMTQIKIRCRSVRNKSVPAGKFLLAGRLRFTCLLVAGSTSGSLTRGLPAKCPGRNRLLAVRNRQLLARRSLSWR